MTFKEFFDKYKVPEFIRCSQVSRFDYSVVLDDMYLRFTKEQVVEMVSEYYDHADEIYNDRQKGFLKGQKVLEDLSASIDKKEKI